MRTAITGSKTQSDLPKIEGVDREPTVLVSPTVKEPFDAITEVDEF